jgi:Transglycosylase SLT domain
MRLGSASHHPGGLTYLATVLLLVLSATGCAGARKAALREDFGAPPEASFPVVTVSTPTETSVRPDVEPKQEPIQEQVSPEHVEAHVRAQVAQRMPAATAITHRKVSTTVLRESTRAGVDPLLVVALIHVESSFNPRARSRAGALGLMQVRVPTLREQLKRPKARRADALDPYTNVQAGVRYFRRMLDTFGATDLALMAYNAGPGRIQRLIAQGSIPPRFRDYSRKVEDELERIRNTLLRPRPMESAQPSLRNMPGLQAVATPRRAS